MNKRVLLPIAVALPSLLAVVLIGWVVRPSSPPVGVVKLLASDAGPVQYFGVAVSASGGRALVGATFPFPASEQIGSAYIYKQVGEVWVEEAMLTPSDGAVGDFFGGAVSLDENVALVGAFGHGHTGALSFDGVCTAYVYRFDGVAWVEQAKLVVSGGTDPDRFGTDVSISGDVALVDQYVFRFKQGQWIEEQKLVPAESDPEARLGQACAIRNDVAVVDATVFRFDGAEWREEAKLDPGEITDEDGFGCSVSIGDDTVVIGALLAGHSGAGQFDGPGAAYVFRFDGEQWEEEAKLTASDGMADDFFGHGVGIWDDLVVIGAHGSDLQGNYAGQAYIYRLDGTGWKEVLKLEAWDGEIGDHFGRDVAIDERAVIVGAYRDDDHRGSVYVFERSSVLRTGR